METYSDRILHVNPDLLDQVLALDDRERLQLEGALRLALAQIRSVDGQKKTAA